MKTRILIVDDEHMFREDLALLLEDQGYVCRTAPDGLKGIDVAREFIPDVVLCDIVMPGMNGVQVLEEVVKICPGACVMMVTAHGTLETAVEAFRKGAFDYILKPLVLEDVFLKIQRYVEYRRLATEVQALRRELQRQEGNTGMVGRSPGIRQIFKLIEKVAGTDSTVLITGESGTGKELVARAVHERGASGNRAFVAVNCAALPENLLESELFGHVKGAFTGADADKPGLFEMANGGTLFLDEVSEMSVSLQAKLLRAIELKEVRRVGDIRDMRVNPRILASTNRDLKTEVGEGRFREDLFYRLRVIELALPPLRDRREDIPLLVAHFVQKYNVRLKKRFLGTDAEAMRILMAYPWPGNVRELENALERAMILADGDFLGVGDLPPDISGSVEFPELRDNLREAMRAYEREHIRQVLDGCSGNREAAAQKLGVNPSTLYRKMSDLGIQES